MTDEELKRFYNLLHDCWSLDTSPRWLPENPARGQCNVTTLVFNDHFGGEILKTPIGKRWHFYNHIGGMRYDLTVEQFSKPPVYLDIQSSREEVLAGTLFKRYQRLAKRVHERLLLKQTVTTQPFPTECRNAKTTTRKPYNQK